MQKNDIHKGDYVVYGTNGICRVEDVCSMVFSRGETPQEYYVICQKNHPASTIYVPVNNDVLRNRMRAILTPKEIETIFSEKDKEDREWIADRKARCAIFQELFLQGDRRGILVMLRCLKRRQVDLQLTGKNLSVTDHEFIQTAEKMLREEISFSLGLSYEDADVYLKRYFDDIQ